MCTVREDKRARHYFDALDVEQQMAAVYRLADAGYSDFAISAATRWHVELVRRALGRRASEA